MGAATLAPRAELARMEDGASAEILRRGLTAAQPAIEAEALRRQEVCRSGRPDIWQGLTVVGSKVMGAELIDEIDGFAKEAGTTGGLGGELAVVTSAADYDPAAGDAAVPGTLRAAVLRAERERIPLWIRFSPALGSTLKITFKTDLRLPDNVTIDGTCTNVMFETASDKGLVYILGKKNIIIARVAFHKTGYASGPRQQRSALRVNGLFDRIAVVHSDFSECGDGCLDITVSPGRPLPQSARITVSYNRFADHDKTMLFGTIDCGLPSLPACDAAYLAARRDTAPALFLTLQGNLFLRTAQRHPRVFGSAMAHLVNNAIAYSALPREHRTWSAAYGTFVVNAGRAYIQSNVYLPLTGGALAHSPRNVWTVNRRAGGRDEVGVEGYIRLEGNISDGRGTFSDNQPHSVPTPSYVHALPVLKLDALSPEQAIGCIAARAGRLGASRWNRELCQMQ